MEKGICPICHSAMLDYDCVENTSDDLCFFKWHCLNCNNEGEEWYKLQFIEHIIKSEV